MSNSDSRSRGRYTERSELIQSSRELEVSDEESGFIEYPSLAHALEGMPWAKWNEAYRIVTRELNFITKSQLFINRSDGICGSTILTSL